MENLNAEQVKKALECLNDKLDRECVKCPVYKLTGRGYSSCRHIILDAALDLINSQEQRIKELAEENERLMEELEKACKVNFYCSFTKSKIQNCPIDDEVAKAKADTVRKMQERLKSEIAKYFLPTFQLQANAFIDRIAKEMLEGENG